MITAGIDIGSLWTKALLLYPTERKTEFYIIKSGFDYAQAAENCMTQVLQASGLKLEDIDYIVGTGYGRARVPYANKMVTEISCHARGAAWVFPEVHTVIDLGGQDSKVIRIGEQQQVVDFAMNDKCAAGTGRFLEVMASALGVELNDMGELALEGLQSTNKVEISSVCTVFGESEVISLFSRGYDRATIAAGLCRAIARRITGLVGQLGLVEKVAMTGGGAKNKGVVAALEEKLGVNLLVPEEPQIIGALGAALFAAEEVARSHTVLPDGDAAN